MTTHTVGNTEAPPVSFIKESEPFTQSYWDLHLTDLVDRVQKYARQNRLAVIAYDIHRIENQSGTITCKIEAFCHPYVLPL